MSEPKTEGWLDETRSAYLYRVLAEVERGSPRSKLFEELAREAEGQAAIWAKNAGLASVPAFVPDLRTRIVAGLVRRYGPRAMRGILAAMKVRGLSVYSHAVPGHPVPTSADEVGKRHRGIAGGGNLRAAVFGINDGLVSNASLILGVAGLRRTTAPFCSPVSPVCWREPSPWPPASMFRCARSGRCTSIRSGWSGPSLPSIRKRKPRSWR